MRKSTTPSPSAALITFRRWLPLLGAVPFVALALSSSFVAYDDHVTPCLWILEHAALPPVDACWECHQPPVYYLLGAGAIAIARALTGHLTPSVAFTALKMLGLLLSLGTIALLSTLTRRFFPRRPGVQAITLAVALVTPRFVLSGVMIGNDTAALFFTTLALWAASPGRPWTRGRAAVAGAAVGVAVLTKYNALALLPAVGIAIVRWTRRDRFARLALATLAFAVVTGPWFARNLIRSGTPLPTRMARVTDIETERYRLFDLRPRALLTTPRELERRIRPGETLPYLSHQVLTPADSSLWTKTYALWWHDALYYLPQPPADWTAARYVAALPVSVLALFGVVLGLIRLFGRAPPTEARHWGASLLLVPLSLGLYFAFVARYPWVRMGHGRASFLLPLLAPFALGTGIGFAALADRRRDGWRSWTIPMALSVTLGALLALCLLYIGFLISRTT